MNNSSLEDQVHDALHGRVDGLQKAPLSLGDVRQQARRIQRRRQGMAGVAIAAALAIAVPVGLAMNGSAPRSIEPAIPSPSPSPSRPVIGTVLIDPVSAAVGDPPAVPILNVDEPSLFTDGTVLGLPKLYDSITPYMDGWVAVANNEGALTLEFLTQDFALQDGPVPTGGLVVSSDEEHLAWSEYNGTRWQIVRSDTEGKEGWSYTPFPPSTQDSVVAPIGFVSPTQVVASQRDNTTGDETAFFVDGSARAKVNGLVKAVSASPRSTAVAGFTSFEEAGSCSGVIDDRSNSGALAWQTCDYSLGTFSPDGRTIVAFPAYYDGYGTTSLSLLDAATGEALVDFKLAGVGNQLARIHERVGWEDDDTLVATAVIGRQQYVVRLGVDGSVERTGGDFTDAPIDTVSLVVAEQR